MNRGLTNGELSPRDRGGRGHSIGRKTSTHKGSSVREKGLE